MEETRQDVQDLRDILSAMNGIASEWYEELIGLRQENTRLNEENINLREKLNHVDSSLNTIVNNTGYISNQLTVLENIEEKVKYIDEMKKKMALLENMKNKLDSLSIINTKLDKLKDVTDKLGTLEDITDKLGPLEDITGKLDSLGDKLKSVSDNMMERPDKSVSAVPRITTTGEAKKSACELQASQEVLDQMKINKQTGYAPKDEVLGNEEKNPPSKSTSAIRPDLIQQSTKRKNSVEKPAREMEKMDD